MAETESADELRYKLNKAEDFIRSQGFRRCDIAACNCNSWHGGNAGARLDEWREMLSEFDISTNGKTLLGATREALEDRARAHEALAFYADEHTDDGERARAALLGLPLPTEP